MAKPPKAYPPEFRRKIMELIRSGESGNAVARRFNVSRQTITNWLKQDDQCGPSNRRPHQQRARGAHDVTAREQKAQDRTRNTLKSRGGFYAWSKRLPSLHRQTDALLGDRIEAIHRRSRATYGRPRIHAELREEGAAISNKRIARLMRERLIQGASRRRTTIATVRDRDARPAPDLVDRNFTADAPDRLRIAEITYVPTWAGFLYLAVVLDVYSRRIVGSAIANHLRTELVLDALNMAIFRRRPATAFTTQIKARSTLRSRLANAAVKPGSSLRWVRSVTATTTRCARVSMRRSNASC